MDRPLAPVQVHVLDEHIHLHLQAGITHFDHRTHQFDDRARRDRVLEVDPVGRHGHQRQAAEARGGDERHFVHPGQGGAAEQGVVVVGGIGEHRLGHAGNRQFGAALDFLVSGRHGNHILGVSKRKKAARRLLFSR
ncbi:hypothetical protein D9M73_161110 [compost metagenome]